MFVKICGLTRPEDVAAAAAAGVDAVGFVLAPSPRRVAPAQARALGGLLPSSVAKVGVFVSPDPAELEAIMAEARLDLAQIHGPLPELLPIKLAGRLIRAARVGLDEPDPGLAAANPRFLLLDTYQPGLAGGTGRTFPWEQAAAYRGLGMPILIAGGLTPENVQSALTAARPDGADVSSGVESAPGVKDPEKIAAFVRAVREWENEHEQEQRAT